MRKHKPIHAAFADALVGRELLQGEQTRLIERDPMRAPRLCGREHRTRWTLGVGTLNSEASGFEIDVGPSQRQDLTSTCARRRAEQKEEMESRAHILG